MKQLFSLTPKISRRIFVNIGPQICTSSHVG
jgi:hypothetical protein